MSDWDFARFVPDMMLINLGTNDFGHDAGPAWEANFSRAYTKVGASHRPPATVQPRGGCPLPSRPHPCERAVHSPMPACPRPVEGRTGGSAWGALAWTTVNPMPMRRHRCRGCGVAVRITAA